MNIKDHSVSKETFSVIYNKKYDCLETIPKPQNISEYYQNERYISHTDGNKGIFEKLYQLVKKYTLKQKLKLIEKYHPNKGSILDIGAGTGDFLRTAHENNWQITGFEPEQKATQIALKKGIYIENSLDKITSIYNVITMWHVLEHIPDLENQILFLKKHICNEGTIIIAVPNYKSKDAQIYKEYWAGYDVPRHLWHFSQQSIQKLFSENGFRIIDTKPMYFDAFYISLLSEKYKTGKMNYIKGFINGFYSNICAIKTKEYSSLIYIIKKK